jgi:hypothetical protein
MWCGNCQQDVPGIASSLGELHVRCARCRAILSPAASHPSLSPGDLVKAGASGEGTSASRRSGTTGEIPFASDEDWEFDDDLLAAESWLEAVETAGGRGSPGAASAWGLADAASNEEQPTPPQPKSLSPARRRRASPLPWLMISLGPTGLAIASSLCVWSLFTGREDVWSLASPVALVGQAGFLVGIALHVRNLWKSSCDATDTLVQLDQELSRLRRTAADLDN